MIFDVRVDGKTYRKFDNVDEARKSRDEFNVIVSKYGIVTGRAYVAVEL